MQIFGSTPFLSRATDEGPVIRAGPGSLNREMQIPILKSCVRTLLLLFMAGLCNCKYPEPSLEVLEPLRYHLSYAPAWFGSIVLPPERVIAEVQYAGDACDCLLGRVAVRGKIALVDRGKCSFLQKVRSMCAAICAVL